MLAIFKSGAMSTFHENSVDVTKMLAGGLADTFSFGPVLVSNGHAASQYPKMTTDIDMIKQRTKMKSTINQNNTILKWLFPTVFIFAIAVFSALSICDQSGFLLSADLSVTHVLQYFHAPIFTKAMIAVSWFGYPPQSILIVILGALVLVLLHKRKEALKLAVSCSFAFGLTSILKLLIHRSRPNASQVRVFLHLHDYSFPSGHVVFYVVFFGFLWYLVYILSRSYKRTVGLILLGIPVVTIGYSRVFLGEHWASDVVGGYILGCMILMACIRLGQWAASTHAINSSHL